MGKSKGDIILKAIQTTGMSVTEWAKQNGFSQTTVSAWINGIRNPKYKSAQRLANSLRVRVEDISDYQSPNNKYDDAEERLSWVMSLSYDVYSLIVNALEENRLDPYQIAKIDDIDDFRNRAILEVSKLDISADNKGKVVSLLSSMELLLASDVEKQGLK